MCFKKMGIICSIIVLIVLMSCGPEAAFCKARTRNLSVSWVKKIAGNISVSVPSNWKAPKKLTIKTAAWYLGDNENKPQAAFAYIWDKVPVQQLLNTCSIKSKSDVKIGGRPATEYRVRSTIAEFDGVIIAGKKVESNGARILIVAAADVNKWAEYGPTLRKIIASIKFTK